MCEVMDRQEEGWLRIEDIKNFACQDLHNIDQLWVKYSQGKFGFSVQKEIWQSCGSPTKSNIDWNKFGVTVGWRTKDGFVMGRGRTRDGFVIGVEWLSYSQITFDLTAPKGHLPANIFSHVPVWSSFIKGIYDVFSKGVFSSLASRLADFNR